MLFKVNNVDIFNGRTALLNNAVRSLSVTM